MLGATFRIACDVQQLPNKVTKQEDHTSSQRSFVALLESLLTAVVVGIQVRWRKQYSVWWMPIALLHSIIIVIFRVPIWCVCGNNGIKTDDWSSSFMMSTPTFLKVKPIFFRPRNVVTLTQRPYTLIASPFGFGVSKRADGTRNFLERYFFSSDWHPYRSKTQTVY